MCNTINRPACNKTKPDNCASSRYTQGPICSECAMREAFEGPFWQAAADAWAQTQIKIAAMRATKH